MMFTNLDTSLTKAISPRSGQQQNYNLAEDIKQRLANSVDYAIVKNLALSKNDLTGALPSLLGKEKTFITYEQITTFSRVDQTVLPEHQANSTREIQTEQISLTISSSPTEAFRSDPLALDLNNDGFTTTGLANGVDFDLLAQGSTQRISVTVQTDPLLALDKNQNGFIDDGTELFGDQTGLANGFEALAQYDKNRDQQIDASDPIYSQLQLLSFDGDGKQQVVSLSSSGIKSISLMYTQQHQTISHNDVIAQTASYTRDDGSVGIAADLLLSVDVNI